MQEGALLFNPESVFLEFMSVLSSMSVERDIRFDLIARLCPNTTGAELRSVATEAGMFAIRARRKVATERDFLDAVEKVVRQGTKFSST
jgi:26S proteasome regulatory subunit T1